MGKRIMAALAVVACAVAATLAMPMAAEAETVKSTGTWGGATYTVYDDGTATVTGKFTASNPGTAPSALQQCKSIDVSGVDTSSVTNMSYMFSFCTQLVSIKGLGSWDTSKVTDMGGMFYECYSLTNLDDIGGWDVSHVQYMDVLLDSCKSLRSVSMAGWDFSGLVQNSTGQYFVDSIFGNCNSLESVWFGPGLTSQYNVIVSELRFANRGSGWRLEDGSKGPYTAEQLYAAWIQHPMPGHWVNTRSNRVSFDANGGAGSMAPLKTSSSITVPASTFSRLGYRFVGWNTVSNGTGTSYVVGATLTPTRDMTLYAIWQAMPTSAQYANGMDVTLHAGEQVTIEGLPAGASYEVTEVPVPSGWTLARQRDTQGIILPHEL